MANEGKAVALHRVDKGGGYIETGTSTDGEKLEVTGLTLANPGDLTFKLRDGSIIDKHSGRAKVGGGPWTGIISGFTGASAGSINGTRTLTRTGDKTVTIGVDTTLLTFDAPNGDEFVTGVEIEENDAEIPSRSSYDYST